MSFSNLWQTFSTSCSLKATVHGDPFKLETIVYNATFWLKVSVHGDVFQLNGTVYILLGSPLAACLVYRDLICSVHTVNNFHLSITYDTICNWRPYVRLALVPNVLSSWNKAVIIIWATAWQNQQNVFVPSEDSDQPGHPPSLISLRCPHEESLGPYLPFEHTVKPLIRLGRCPGWSESSLSA